MGRSPRYVAVRYLFLIRFSIDADIARPNLPGAGRCADRQMSGEWGATQGKGCVQGGDRRSSHGRIGTLMHPLSFVAFYSARTNTYIGSPSQTKKCRAGRRTTVDGRGLAQDGNGGRRDGRRIRRSGRTRTFVQQQWERHRPLRCDHFSWFDLNLIPNCYLTCLLFRSRPPAQESDNT